MLEVQINYYKIYSIMCQSNDHSQRLSYTEETMRQGKTAPTIFAAQSKTRVRELR